MTGQRREQAHFLAYISLLVVCVQLCEKNDATAQTDSANRTKRYAIIKQRVTEVTSWATHTGSAGGLRPLAGARGVLASFLFLRRQAAQESHLSRYERRPASAFYSSKNRSVDIAPFLSITSAIYLEQCYMLISVVLIVDF
jgi:hypothetical protein